MADGSIASLYPAPAAPPQAVNALAAGNPIDLAGGILAVRARQIANATAEFELGAKQNSYLMNAIGTLADKPNVSPDDVASMVTTLSRNTNMPSSTTAPFLAGLPTGQALQTYLTTLKNAAIGSQAASVRETGPLSPTGQQTTMPLGGANYAGAYPTGLAPGVEAAATVAGTGSAARAQDLTNAADGVPTRKAMLGNLQGDLQSFTSGPGADWSKVAKAWLNRNVLPTTMQFDPKSIASQEQFTKQAEQLAQQQFSAIGGTGTDSKFGSAFRSNPNDALSQLGNQRIINLLQGNEDAIAAKNKAWQQWLASGKGPQSYPAFSASFNQSFDPRVYQAQYMSRSDFMNMVKAMSPAEQQMFKANQQRALANGFASAPGGLYNGQ